MIKQLIIFVIFSFILTPTHKGILFNFVVSNTGQGAWSTLITPLECLHFDMGGDFFKNKPLIQDCRNKKNRIFITHLDWDHINLIKKYKHRLQNICIFYPKKIKQHFLKQIPKCKHLHKDVKLISLGASTGDSNSSSLVYLIKNKILITGDAPISEEHKWFRKVPKNLKILILGHHGSYTSTSVKLLKWSHIQYAIASARHQKYGHPHRKVVEKLKSRKIPLLRTELLGHIQFLIQ